jgi:acetyl-CoA carboxylase carboxyl transferase subunit beta
MALFGKPKYTIVRLKKKDMPDGLWTKCEGCSDVLYNKTLEESFKVCPKCNYHFILGAYERINMLLDNDTFQEYDKDMLSSDPLNFKGPKTYKDKLIQEQQATGLKEAAVSGEGFLDNKKIIIAVTDSRFIMGSMGSVVGEKITLAIERATEGKITLIICCASGGARMMEGLISLMQMAKTSAALARFHETGGLYISILTDPTTAGVAASFATLGDIIIAEPGALVGFAGPRVIWHTTKTELPEGFQTSEFVLEHGFIDMIVPRKDLRNELARLIDYCGK